MAGESEQHPERPRRDLRIQLATRRVGGRGNIELFAPEVGVGVDLDQRERQGPLDLGAQASHPLQFLLRRDDVLACCALRGQLENGLAAGCHRPAEAEHLVFGGKGARHRLAVHGPVGDRS